jgi:hypothetical protein
MRSPGCGRNRLTNLAAALRTRYEALGVARDIDEAVALAREAVTATPAESPERADRLAT